MRCWPFSIWVTDADYFCFLQYSICKEPLIELSNPGASGSLFYLTSDDEFIIKTVQHKEAEFLQKLLPGYYMVSLNRSEHHLKRKELNEMRWLSVCLYREFCPHWTDSLKLVLSLDLVSQVSQDSLSLVLDIILALIKYNF